MAARRGIWVRSPLSLTFPVAELCGRLSPIAWLCRLSDCQLIMITKHVNWTWSLYFLELVPGDFGLTWLDLVLWRYLFKHVTAALLNCLNKWRSWVRSLNLYRSVVIQQNPQMPLVKHLSFIKPWLRNTELTDYLNGNNSNRHFNLFWTIQNLAYVDINKHWAIWNVFMVCWWEFF